MYNYHGVKQEMEMRQQAVRDEVRAIRLAQAATKARHERVPVNCYSVIQRLIARINAWRLASRRLERPAVPQVETAVPCP